MGHCLTCLFFPLKNSGFGHGVWEDIVPNTKDYRDLHIHPEKPGDMRVRLKETVLLSL